ncbi:MAG: DUF3828 domain-containing protein [Hyphomonadaceae bacterium]
MKRIGIALLALAAACSQEAPPQQQAEEKTAEAASSAVIQDPAAAIRPLYDRYITAPAQWPALEESAPWSDDLRAQLVAMMARSEAINEPILDFDPLIGAQDGDIRAVTVGTDSLVPESHAVVRARFVNMGEPKEIVLDLVWQNEAWRVDNVRGSDFDLRQVIAAPPQ